MDKFIKMLKKFLREFREMLEKFPYCQMQATAVIWAEPIKGLASKFGGAAPKSGGGWGTASPLPHAGYGTEYINIYCTKL